jgi:sigma-B regulation protein RsbU (phosphoserine phosphatase)
MANSSSQPSRQSDVRFRERVELLDFLLEVSRVTAETLDLDELLSRVASIVKDVVPYELFAILLYSDRDQGLKIRYSIGHREEIVRSLVIPLNEGITGLAASTREPVLVNDVRTESRYLNALDAVRSELAVPLISRSKLVGVLDIQSTRVDAYTEQDRSLLRLIGARVAASIENARLYRRVEQQNRTMKTLVNLSQEFSSILDLNELLTKIAGTVRAIINYDAFSIFMVDVAHNILRHRFGVRYDERVDVDHIPMGMGITGAAVSMREAIRVVDTAKDPRYITRIPGIRSEVAVPLMVQDRVIGVLDVESERIGFFTEDHKRTLSLLAPQIASSIENARLYEELTSREQRMEQDLKAARKLQRVLLPRSAPDLDRLETGIRSRPAREISGDVYDFFVPGEDDAVIAFGDVSGKGAAAALYGALISGFLRTLAPRRRKPSELLKLLNETLLERKVDAQYATLCIARWKASIRRLTLANAGAEPLFICRQGEIIKPRAEGVPIGLLEDREYEEVEIDVLPGDTILLFSDGVEDQLNFAGEDYSRARVSKLLKKHAADPAQAIANVFFEELDEFRGSTPITDDQTIVVLKVTS